MENIFRFDYFAIFDLDEVIIPKNHSNWAEMMTYLKSEEPQENREQRAAYTFDPVYFNDNMQDNKSNDIDNGVPSYMHMMRHVYRSPPHKFNGKSIVSSKHVLIPHVHSPLTCLGDTSCVLHPVNEHIGDLHHYRFECSYYNPWCKELEQNLSEDTYIWRWKEEVIHGTTDTLSSLGFFNKR